MANLFLCDLILLPKSASTNGLMNPSYRFPKNRFYHRGIRLKHFCKGWCICKLSCVQKLFRTIRELCGFLVKYIIFGRFSRLSCSREWVKSILLVNIVTTIWLARLTRMCAGCLCSVVIPSTCHNKWIKKLWGIPIRGLIYYWQILNLKEPDLPSGCRI